MNRLVARDVMGWRWTRSPDFDDPINASFEVAGYEVEVANEGRFKVIRGPEWSPYTDIADAWEVVEKLLPDYHFTLVFGWTCRLRRLGYLYEGQAATAPAAICYAALNAAHGKGIEVKCLREGGL